MEWVIEMADLIRTGSTPQVVNPDNAALGASIHYGLAGLVGLMGAVIAVM